MVTLSARMGNPTEPMTQGLLFLLPSKYNRLEKIIFAYYTFLCSRKFRTSDTGMWHLMRNPPVPKGICLRLANCNQLVDCKNLTRLNFKCYFIFIKFDNI